MAFAMFQFEANHFTDPQVWIPAEDVESSHESGYQLNNQSILLMISQTTYPADITSFSFFGEVVQLHVFYKFLSDWITPDLPPLLSE